MSVYIDISCDMGESYGRGTLGHDEAVMPHITSANVACGFHGGDPHVMRGTVALALALYDPRRPEPILLRAGDRVRFRVIDPAEFDRIAVEDAGGRFLIAPPSRKGAEAGRSTGRRA